MNQRNLKYTVPLSRRFGALAAATVIALGAILSIDTAPTAPVRAESSEELRSEIDNLVAEQERLEAERSETVETLEQAEAEKAVIESQINLKLQEIAANQQLVDTMDVKIEEKNYQIALRQQAIAEKEAAIATEFEALRERLRALSKVNTVTSLLQLLISSDGMTDYLIKSKTMQRLSEENERLMAELETEMQAINAEKAVFENEKAVIEEERKPFVEAQTALTIAKQELDVLYSEKTAMTDKLNQDIDNFNASIAAAEEKQRELQAEIDRIIAENVGSGQSYLSGSMYWPAPSCNYISSLFAFRWGSWHNGLDLCGSGCYGTPIVAAADGVVTYADWMGGYGYTVILDHGRDSAGRNVTTVYAHAAWQPEVSVGASVFAGQTIAYVGSTGYSTGPHLHFEVRLDGAAVDPLSNGYLSTSGIIIDESL